ncbi:jg15270 [Pararge aegeria aegeria]|uniref:Jg15270 protein n=1 Tax=Pararge aegeria aegeria TaxID=348720 RepID=A0A8S4R051_9NEOP|nr:jg15270 [Pararge aegeria aegeria]
MESTFLCLLLSVLVSIAGPANGCTIEGIDNWLVAESQHILDTFRGNLWDRSTSNIQGINSISYTDGLNQGPYVTISFVDSRLVISTNDAFENYEEYETLASMGFTISFRCSDGSTRPFVFQVGINDTNNNDPQFRPTNAYAFTIAPPIPPGFLITNCVDDIIVRDIDLTTERIDFEISGSSLFQVTYDDSSTVAKEFKAALRTTTLIRSISEPIILSVKATDVDRTGDPRRSATATITITADTEFTFPDEPIFSQPFYLATYTDNEIILQDSIFLRQGYDDQVVFSFDGQYSQYFDIATNGNNVYFNSKSPLPVNLYREGHIFLVVTAERDYTSGAAATIVVQLPEAINLAFEAGLYKGSIEDNKLNLEDLKLKQGYNDTTITVDITSDYTTYFSASVNANTITLSMAPLSESIIKENNVINLQVTATTALNSSATTIVTLEIIKDDTTTPVFERNLYNGSYDLEIGLNLEQIVLIQGYDSSVTLTLEGEHSSLFEKEQNGPMITLAISSLPSELFAERNILVLVRATKARTVGANTVVHITLPPARELSFEKSIYKGNLEDNIIVLENIFLSLGYDSDVIFNLTGDHADYFNINYTKNELSLGVQKPLEDMVLENSFLVLVLIASGNNAVTASATIVLEIIKKDNVTPVFSKYIYQGTYMNSTYVDFEAISLIQGYDDTVTFELDGDHAKYFSMNLAENHVMLTLISAIPEDLIFNEKVLLFNVKAEKPWTVGANAAIRLIFPEDLTKPAVLKFSQNTYNGLLKDDLLTMENIVLESGFTAATKFSLSGEYVENFTMSNSNNEIEIKLSETASLEVLKINKYLILEIAATRERAVPVTSTLVIDISNTQVILPVFEKAFYTGTFTKDGGLQFTEEIRLQLGFDEAVTFKLEGDHAEWFSVFQNANSVLLLSNATNPLPEEVFDANNHLLFTIIAQKPDTIGGRAAISISLLKEIENTVVLQFERNSYVGHIENGSLIFTDNIRIIDTDLSSVGLNLTGEYASYFTLSKESNIISINLLDIPEDDLYRNDLIILYLEASARNAISSHTTIILNVIKTTETPIIQPLFELAYYVGEYSKYDGLTFSQTIRLKQGFDDTVSFELEGDLATSFESSLANGNVAIDVATSAAFPENITYIPLTLHADIASAVLILDVSPSDPNLPTVSFSSTSYFLWADINQTGMIGRVQATVDNNEAVLYSVTVDDDLRERVSINAEGELLLLAKVDRGIYNFKVSAIAQSSQVSATAPVLLRVDALPECSTEDGLPPLIVLQRVEEEPHLNLVVLNQTDNKDCWYTITSLWPEDQSWLYIENGGLHAKVIDREDKSIAFMIQSQIQAELILHCDNDNGKAIVKRSLATDIGSGLDTYNYGSNKWVLADTITYNARRSVVNLIVEDINDNAPIFNGKENEPIYIGYPIPELENTILPRALIELKATDADIGENAALMYFSMEENLAVASTTGYVHVRNNANLQNDSRLTVYAIDQNGRGLNGSIDIVIKLLEENQIAVMTVQNAFLDDEDNILSNLSTSVGYDIKILRTVVISENNDESEETSRKKRDIANTSGASLQLFVYGISGNQLINVDKLTSDLDQVVLVDKFRVKSLEDHLESLEICPVPGQNTALIASTIALAVVLFITILAISGYIFIKWRKKKNYEKFSDANSLASRVEVESVPKIESPSKPRLDIEELKRSERRLQEMLDAPVPAIAVHPPKQEINPEEKYEPSVVISEETLINITADPQPPIIIQSIDKLKDITDEPEEDEFGEVKITTPRKSVVTFNENVEKIIHIDYDLDDNSEPETEVYRF